MATSILFCLVINSVKWEVSILYTNWDKKTPFRGQIEKKNEIFKDQNFNFMKKTKLSQPYNSIQPNLIMQNW